MMLSILFICLFSICISSLMRCLFNLCLLKNWVDFFLLNFKLSLHIWDISTLYDMCLHIFYQYVAWVVILLIVSLTKQFLIIKKSNLSIFISLSMPLLLYTLKLITKLSHRFSPMYYSRIFSFAIGLWSILN